MRSNEELAEFTSRQLNDTRYSTKLAAEYLGLLYGGRDSAQPDGPSIRKVYASPGGLTAILRRNWGLEAILRETGAAADPHAPKSRSDHRHHAIDAIAIALSSPSAVKALSDAADQNARRGRTSFRGVPAPWPNFVDSIRPHIEGLVVSHRPEHKLSGPLHDETLYSRPYEHNGKTYVHVRKAVDSLSTKEVEQIVDPAVRAAVHDRLRQLGGDLKKLQVAANEPPCLPAGERRIPIRRVRIRKVLTPTVVGQEPKRRFVEPNNNHHTEILAVLDRQDKEIRWEGLPVSLLDAMRRHKTGSPVVQRDHGPGYRFQFSIANGDTIEVDRTNGQRTLMIVRSIWSNGQLTLLPISDARKQVEAKKLKQMWFPNAERLRKLRCRKVTVDLLGRIHPAHD